VASLGTTSGGKTNAVGLVRHHSTFRFDHITGLQDLRSDRREQRISGLALHCDRSLSLEAVAR
jgi:hypothetical protein